MTREFYPYGYLVYLEPQVICGKTSLTCHLNECCRRQFVCLGESSSVLQNDHRKANPTTLGAPLSSTVWSWKRWNICILISGCRDLNANQPQGSFSTATLHYPVIWTPNSIHVAKFQEIIEVDETKWQNYANTTQKCFLYDV